MISENLTEVQENIRNACQAAGRDENEVTLIAVSKTKPIQQLMEAYDCGCRHFGENKVQELVSKYEAMPKDIKWHMIGHLQRNKVKYIIDKAALIHSVDSLRLAEEISREAVKKNIEVSILIEVNAAHEESKFGVTVDETLPLIQKISLLPNIHIKGLMTIAPYVENSEENKPYFEILRQLAVDISSKNIDNVSMNVLSMGMTGDYMTAVRAGATLVRVGTGIFGQRQYDV